MDRELASYAEGTPERYVPEAMRGELVEAEHLARYWWAAGLVEDKRVLDAGCGLGYGSAIMADAGAIDVVGVDVAEAVVEAAHAHVPDTVRLRVGDVRSLPFEDDSFDAAVCFEVLEHLDDPERAIAELARVLRRAGVLAVSSPNRAVYVPGNPHHRHEFLPEELRAVLGERFAHVHLFRQHDWIASAVVDDETFESEGPVADLAARTAVASEPGEELYTIALAGDRPLEGPPPLAVFTRAFEARRWMELYDEQRAALEQLEQELVNVQTLLDERAEALERLREAEQLVARIPELERAVEEHREQLELVHGTRVWRAGERFWQLRARLRGRPLE
ncbi:MAG: methyltransferase domain-containing protein [Gaiellaceae bacterium]